MQSLVGIHEVALMDLDLLSFVAKGGEMLVVVISPLDNKLSFWNPS